MEQEPSIPTDPERNDEFEGALAQAAGRLVESAPEEEIPQAEKLYDAACDLVERREDQGIDRAVAWEEADPSGKIRRNFQMLEEKRQDALNHKHLTAIRQATHDAKVAEIEQIYDPKERARAMRELLAVERAQAERRGRRW